MAADCCFPWAWAENMIDRQIVLNNLVYIGLNLRVHNRKLFSYSLTKTYVVGTQKNLLKEMMHKSTQNIC